MDVVVGLHSVRHDISIELNVRFDDLFYPSGLGWNGRDWLTRYVDDEPNFAGSALAASAACDYCGYGTCDGWSIITNGHA
ncbi:Uncharacterised protein [Vibrio cholerae]|uniref:Uncharacterized protein n=1 Tax=Vibrio cholerae TaxID=666 RepID=A0A655ZRK9_VIBCL|nr:Uncharacterised protein [Vibrio cholerae]